MASSGAGAFQPLNLMFSGTKKATVDKEESKGRDCSGSEDGSDSDGEELEFQIHGDEDLL